MNEYQIQDHIHLFSSWAAGRASSVKDNRFKVEIGQRILSNNKKWGRQGIGQID